MDHKNEIWQAYCLLGKKAALYDGMITCSTLFGRLVCRLVWNMGKQENERYLELILSQLSSDFSGRLLEVPVGTGVLTIPYYQKMPKADITCLDYSPNMMSYAAKRADFCGIKNIDFLQGDVGKLPFEDESFDMVLSLNGFHVFPDKEAAYAETFRVLKKGGTFLGCFYIKGENKRTDRFIGGFYTRKGFFTPPFETCGSLSKRLNSMYSRTNMDKVKSIVCFNCVK